MKSIAKRIAIGLATGALAFGVTAGAGVSTAQPAQAGTFSGSSLQFFTSASSCAAWQRSNIDRMRWSKDGRYIAEMWCRYDPSAQNGHTTGKPWVGYVGWAR